MHGSFLCVCVDEMQRRRLASRAATLLLVVFVICRKLHF